MELSPLAWLVADLAHAAAGQLRAALPLPARWARQVHGGGAAERAGRTRRPVLLLPGIWEPWQVMAPLGRRLREAGHPVLVVDLGRNVGPIAEAVRVAAEAIAEPGSEGGMLLVAHSKGGLIGRELLRRDVRAGTEAIAGMVSIATPYEGSSLARLLPVASVRELTPRGVAGLSRPVAGEASLEQEVRSRITAIRGRRDTLIPHLEPLPGAVNVQVPVAGHWRVLSDPQTQQVVLAALRRHEQAAQARIRG